MGSSEPTFFLVGPPHLDDLAAAFHLQIVGTEDTFGDSYLAPFLESHTGIAQLAPDLAVIEPDVRNSSGLPDFDDDPLDVLPRVIGRFLSSEFLRRMMEGKSVAKVAIDAKDSDFVYSFD